MRPTSLPSSPALHVGAVRVVVGVVVAAMAVVGLMAPAADADTTISDTIDILDPLDASPIAVALRFSQVTFADDTADDVLLATNAAFADALASGTLQGSDTPLLLTSPDTLHAGVAAEIERLGASEVTILGGVNAITADVEEALLDLGLDVDRVAGDTRVETAIEVAQLAPESSTAIVARAFGSEGDETRAFADALAAGAWAAEEGWPVLLTQTDILSPDTRELIEGGEVERVVVLGGEAAISAAVEDELEALVDDVDRIAGPTRFATAVAVAAQRGFDSSADAERVILVEAQAPDAWAAGFAAAAHGALIPAPVVLANGDTLPEATVEFLLAAAATPDETDGQDDPATDDGTTGDGTFAVDAAAVDDPVLVCAASPVACEQARLLLGLPQRAEIIFDDIDADIPSRSELTGTIDLFDEDATVAVFGDCVLEGLVVPAEDDTFAIDVRAEPGPCEIELEVTYANGTIQRIAHMITVAPALPATGTVTDTETGGDAYTLVPDPVDGDRADEALLVDYTDADSFVVDGEPATIGAFEASITVADRITFSADTAEGSVHELTNVDPSSIDAGTVGEIDLGAGTYAIVEPVSGVVLRGGLAITDGQAFTVDGSTASRATFEADINEGDEIRVSAAQLRLTNDRVRGSVNSITIDAISGIARFRIGGLGDDPLNAEDDRFRARAGTAAQTFSVDGRSTDFAGFAAALSDGDDVTYGRVGGVESFQLRNEPLPPTSGLVTETSDPDGSAVAPEPSDGGSIVVLTAEGRREVTYSADAVFRLDGAVATEAEFEAQRTPGDEVIYQPADSGTDTAEEISLINRDLAGEVTDITEGANAYDVRVRSGVVYDDLDYAAGVFGGSDVYVVNGDTTGLAQFENALALIDRGEVLGSIVIRATPGGTEHRLTTETG